MAGVDATLHVHCPNEADCPEDCGEDQVTLRRIEGCAKECQHYSLGIVPPPLIHNVAAINPITNVVTHLTVVVIIVFLAPL